MHYFFYHSVITAEFVKISEFLKLYGGVRSQLYEVFEFFFIICTLSFHGKSNFFFLVIILVLRILIIKPFVY